MGTQKNLVSLRTDNFDVPNEWEKINPKIGNLISHVNQRKSNCLS